ncbi:MAG: DUF2797 domain-containing protein [Bacteroidetes bacterium]|nr:DUF2797 domain-containing protein [Bacteroidota bacterium]MCB0854323.1 DUF2797 domain-containing protein [Bacteroidota bacterium]
MTYQGNLKKMKVVLNNPVEYTLELGEDKIHMNDLIGKEILFKYDGVINCKICGRKIKKTFGEGFCYEHFINHPANSECIIRPELCEGHLGKGRDPEWELENHVQPHVVYLAIASGLKVGVTRGTQVPTRWIDQGAWKAIRLAEVPNRFMAGQIEVALKDHISDKTHWQKMLKNELADHLDIIEEKQKMQAFIPDELSQYYSSNDEIVEISYPALQFPTKVKSLSFDKLPEVGGKLEGIKGQYLIFDEGRVINLRKFTGYFVELVV